MRVVSPEERNIIRVYTYLILHDVYATIIIASVTKVGLTFDKLVLKMPRPLYTLSYKIY